MTTHTIKSWPTFFRAIVAGTRTHELRQNDRSYAVGDFLDLREYDPQTDTYTGAQATVEITSITSEDAPCAVSDRGLSPGFCILSVKVAVWSEPTNDAAGAVSTPPSGRARD